MAAPVIASQGAFAAYTGAASLAIPVPTGVVVGSKVVAHISCAWHTSTAPTSANITPPSGFALAYGTAFTDTTDGYVMYEAWYEKTANAADSGTYAFAGTAVGGAAALVLGGVAFRITGAADPALGGTLQSSPTEVTGASSYTFTSFVPAQTDTLLICFGSSFGNAGATTTVPTGWTNLGKASGSGAGGIMAADLAVGAPTATGALTFSLASSDFAWGTIAQVLSPVVTVNATVDAAVASGTGTAGSPTIITSGAPSGGIPTLSGETSRTTGATTAGTPYTKVVGSIANATSGSSDGYIAYFPTASTSNIDLMIWNHPYQSPYDADIAGAGDSGWTFALTSWLLDNNIAIASSNDAGDQFGLPPVMASITNLYNAINVGLGVSNLIMYGESMGGSACLNWTARNNAAPLVGAMLVSGVCDTSKFTSYFTYDAAYNPMLTAASDWAGLPIFLASSPSDTTVLETENAQPFATHVSGQAVVTSVETTGGHLTSGNYPVSTMQSWILSVLPASVNTVIEASVAIGTGAAHDVTVTVVSPPPASDGKPTVILEGQEVAGSWSVILEGKDVPVTSFSTIVAGTETPLV